MSTNKRILVVSTENKHEYEIGIYNTLKELGYKASLTKITSLIGNINSGTHIYYNGKDILEEYDVVIPFIDQKHIDMFHFLLYSAEQHNLEVLISSKAIRYSMHYGLFLSELSKNNVRVLKTYVSKSKSSLESILDDIAYPIVIKLPDTKKEIVVKSKESLTSLLDTVEIMNKPLILREILPDMKSIEVMYVGGKVYGLKYDKDSDAYGKLTPNAKIVATVDKVAKILDAQLFALKGMVDDAGVFYVDDLFLHPNFEKYLDFYPSVVRSLVVAVEKPKDFIGHLRLFMKFMDVSKMKHMPTFGFGSKER